MPYEVFDSRNLYIKYKHPVPYINQELKATSNFANRQTKKTLKPYVSVQAWGNQEHQNGHL